MNPVEKAVQAIGTQADTARAMHVIYQNISLWVKAGKVPACRAVELSRLSGIDYRELSPDFNWPTC